MLYTLDDIPLSLFVDMYLGDDSKAVKEGSHTPGETRRAARRMCGEYLSIVGGKSALWLIRRRSDWLDHHMRISSLEACLRLARLGDTAGARAVLERLGHRPAAAEGDGLAARAENLLSMERYALARLERASASRQPAREATREDFARERVAVMARVRMHIDPDVFKAREYAYLLRQVCDEAERQLKAARRKGGWGHV